MRVPVGVVGVHEVAVVQEAVPAAVLDLGLVEAGEEVEVRLEGLGGFGLGVGGGPVGSYGLGGAEVGWVGDEDGGVVDLGDVAGQLLLGRRLVEGY